MCLCGRNIQQNFEKIIYILTPKSSLKTVHKIVHEIAPKCDSCWSLELKNGLQLKSISSCLKNMYIQIHIKDLFKGVSVPKINSRVSEIVPYIVPKTVQL